MATLIQWHARRIVQIGFLILTLIIGIQFQIFVHQLETGSDSVIARPSGVEAFLPISALISFKYWVQTGLFSRVHPSGLVILLIVLAVALFLKKGFCGWVCPIGLGSELLATLRKLLPGQPWKMPAFADIPLRAIKYLILAFFLWAIFIQMDTASLWSFINSPYNRMADIKMLHFFTRISTTTLATLSLLLILTFLFRGFWCRYLCPYGALQGFASLLSPFKIRRNVPTCTGCRECTAACPSSIAVHTMKSVFSDECHACYKCVEACPEKKTLEFSAGNGRISLPKPIYALALVLLFLIGTGVAMSLNLWRNDIPNSEYRARLVRINLPAYECNRGRPAAFDD